MIGRATPTFRVFVSSTFADLKAERDALQRHVFPRLRQLCAEHGARFQAIDLRWGIRQEAALDQRTMAICLDELAKCRRTSPRPHFILLLGNRYGWRPLPYEIPDAEYTAIHAALDRGEDRTLLERWYRRDDNAQPPVYCLQHRSGEFVDDVRWSAVEGQLRSIIAGSIERATDRDDLRNRFLASATEHEIREALSAVLGDQVARPRRSRWLGALSALLGFAARPDRAGGQCFCYLRTIRNLAACGASPDYLDRDDHGNVDPYAATRLAELRALLLERLPEHTRQYEISWSDGAPTLDHIEPLCADVWTDLSRVIQNELNERAGGVDSTPQVHARFGSDRAGEFVGESDVVRDMLADIQHHPGKCRVLVGSPGSGKTMVMARLASEVVNSVQGVCVVQRYVGVTPDSSDPRSLIDGVCQEIAERYQVNDRAAADARAMKATFKHRLQLATRDHPLVIFLDGLEQLDISRSTNWDWLTCEMPADTNLIISGVPLELARLPASAQHYQLRAMSRTEGGRLLDAWLSAAGRRLQEEQRTAILDHLAGAGGSPFYLRLLFEQARHWRSYSAVPDLTSDIRATIRDMFHRWSQQSHHGPVLVSRVLEYLGAAKNGLAEDELIDLLSNDADVFQDFVARSRHSPPEQRLPVAVWARLLGDLEPYLAVRGADGGNLLTFSSRQVREVAEAEFHHWQDRHRTLARYFAAQPLFSAAGTPNLRKLSELPYQQTRGELWTELFDTLTDAAFIEAKCTHVAVTEVRAGERVTRTCGGVFALQDDYLRALERLPPDTPH